MTALMNLLAYVQYIICIVAKVHSMDQPVALLVAHGNLWRSKQGRKVELSPALLLPLEAYVPVW